MCCFNDEDEYVFASYLIRFRVDTNQANPDYISYVINSQIGRQQIDALSRKITGQANINSDEIRSLEIPLPPLEVQQELVQQIQEARQAIQQAKDNLKQEIEAEIEEIILGTKSVTDDNL